MKLILPYPPSTNALYATVRGRRVKTAAARQYKLDAASVAARSGIGRYIGDVTVRVDVFRPARRGDLDNTLKSILDSLTGIAWDDDSQVRCIYAERREDKVNPRVEVEIIQP
jgi:crossover junction endodeoxyribonuclease RusA